jgi:hypothetical protein
MPMPLSYSPTRHRYLRDDGKPASDRDIQDFLLQENQAGRLRLQAIAQRYLLNRLTLEQWETTMRQELREAHLRLAALAAGGDERITPQMRWQIDGLLTEEFAYLRKFRDRITPTDAPQLTHLELSRRAQTYADALKLSWSKVELAVRIAEGGWEGWRRPDPTAASCKQCPKHRTPGYVPVEQIVAIGDQCECRAYCQCKITYRRMN